MEFTTKKVCAILHRDRKTQTDDIATGHCGHVPPATNGIRFWSADDIAGELFFMEQRAEGHSVKMAGALASRLRRAMTDHPSADQIELVTLENGNRFSVPTDAVDLTSGYNSGCAVREAVMVDVRNLRARVAMLIELDAGIAGEADGD